MTPGAAKATILVELRAVLAASAYATMPLAMPDEILRPVVGAPFGSTRIRHVASVQASQGPAGARKWERFYMLMVDLRAPGGEGSEAVDAIGAALTEGLQGKQLSGPGPEDQVIIGVVEPTEPMEIDASWSLLTLFVPFRFYHVM